MCVFGCVGIGGSRLTNVLTMCYDVHIIFPDRCEVQSLVSRLS